MSVLKNLISIPMSSIARIFSRHAISIFRIREWITLSPSSRNKSRIMVASSIGVLQMIRVRQYWAKHMFRSNSNSLMCQRISGVCLCMRLSSSSSILFTPLISSKHSLQFLPYIIPMNTQNTFSSNPISSASNSGSQSVLDSDERMFKRLPHIRFMPCVYPILSTLEQAVSMLHSFSLCLSSTLVLGTSLTMMSLFLPSPLSSSQQQLSLNSCFILLVSARISQNSFLTSLGIPFIIEKMRFFWQMFSRLLFLSTIPHSQRVRIFRYCSFSTMMLLKNSFQIMQQRVGSLRIWVGQVAPGTFSSSSITITSKLAELGSLVI